MILISLFRTRSGGIGNRLLSQHERTFIEQASNVTSGSGSAIRTEESSRSGVRFEPATGLASTADAVNRKSVVAFGR